MMATGEAMRHHEYDWIRVLVTINLIPFHAAWLMTFVGGFSFIDQQATVSLILRLCVSFFSPLHMYLLFLVSGISTALSLRRRTPGEYVVERIKRLLIPLLFFMVFLYSPLAYFWPGSPTGNGAVFYFTRFWPYMLSTIHYAPEAPGPRWAHMWFVAYLFIYSLLMLPFFAWAMRIGSGRTNAVMRLLCKGKGSIYLMAVPLVFVFAVMSVRWPLFQLNLITDWGYVVYNLTAFIYGFVICTHEELFSAIKRHMKASLILGVVFSVLKLLMEYRFTSFAAPAYNLRYSTYSVIAGLNTWFWVAAALGLAGRYLAFSNRFLRYFNRISYPFYIFHLTVMVVIGYYVVRLRMGALPEFLVLGASSFVFSVLLCELVKSNRVTRFLFGMK
ncbi:MAG: acyltransferase family protein [Kiritimatiellae bacterium]|nr:acyltransferase family protein [Kiritimatiellia bacterium]